jgi:hypothetical protein
MQIGRRIVRTLVVVTMLVALVPTTAVASGDVFQPADESPAANPCKKKDVPDDIYKRFKDLLAELLGDDAGIVDDIEAQVKGKVPDDDEKAVKVEIVAVDEKEFEKQYAEDVDGLYEGKDAKDLKKDAKDIFKNFGAYAYITKDLNADGTQVIKIAVFCKTSMRTGTIDGTIRELIVHELVHAKLYTMFVLGVAEDDWPFPDHDDDAENDGKSHGDEDDPGDKEFWDEVKRLYEKLKKNLDISYAPNDAFEAPAEALVSFEHGDIRNPVVIGGLIVARTGERDVTSDSVPVEIVSMSLSGTTEVGPILIEGLGTGWVRPADGTEPFPALSSLDLSFWETTLTAGGSGRAVLGATTDHWPPFGVTYLPDDPGETDPPIEVAIFDATDQVQLLSLTVLAGDADGDGIPDHLDPDDDNDGFADVEDLWPLDAGKPKLKKRTLECAVATGSGLVARCP